MNAIGMVCPFSGPISERYSDKRSNRMVLYMEKFEESHREKDAGFIRTFQDAAFILAEAAVIEALRRSHSVRLHPQLEHALLIYDNRGRQELEKLYLGFAGIATAHDLPLMICAPTWRANRQRLTAAGIRQDVNADAVRFMKGIRRQTANGGKSIFIGGLVGCKNDCYRPQDALPEDEAAKFHSWQINKLASTDLDFMLAATLPSTAEARGIARAMGRTGRPYFISFVIGSNGRILDGNSLDAAIGEIDAATPENLPVGYMINCAYPSFLQPDSLSTRSIERLVGFQANASSRDQFELDGSAELLRDDIGDWSAQMAALHRRQGVKILGGCCGTGLEHLKHLVDRLFPTYSKNNIKAAE